MEPYYQDDYVTLYHGDCREILPTIADASIDCIFTDPPYGHNNNNGDLIHHWEAALGRGPAGESRPIANDGGIDTNSLIRWSFTEWRRLLKPGGCCCCCGGGGGPDPQFARWSLWLDEVLDFKQMVIWDKGPIGMGWHYRRSYETVLVAQKAGAACKWYDDSQTIENIIRPGDYGIRKIIPSAAHHPTPKPEALVRHFVRLHTKPGDLVLDPFLGAGPTARACKDIGRRCVGIELDEQWIEIAARRMAQEPLPLGA